MKIDVEPRWSDYDQQGLLWNVVQMQYVEEAIRTALRLTDHPAHDQLGRDQPLASGRGLAVRVNHIEYHAVARSGDNVTVLLWVSKVGRTSVTFDFRLATPETVVASGFRTIVNVDTAGHPTQWTTHARSVLESPELAGPST